MRVLHDRHHLLAPLFAGCGFIGAQGLALLLSLIPDGLDLLFLGGSEGELLLQHLHAVLAHPLRARTAFVGGTTGRGFGANQGGRGQEPEGQEGYKRLI